ncbi:MAG: hypothetical protein HQM01_11460 [Magnetococcales bacterium]|nr:hypothetical protein [Magnetococcales bacterium]
MSATSHALFGRIKALENRLDAFLDLLSDFNIQFRAGITCFWRPEAVTPPCSNGSGIWP